jgi:hypothetical protein
MNSESVVQETLVDRDAFWRDINTIASDNGVPFGRLQPYWQAESDHVQMMRSNNAGTLGVARAFQCLFLESVELLNVSSMQPHTMPQLTFYKRNFVPHMVTVFQQLCASDLMATHGYPLFAFAMLRNTYDHLVLIAAAMHQITDFFKIEGSIPGKTPFDRDSRTVRKKTEQGVRRKMTGQDSGMSAETIKNLKLWNDIFDSEVHGARFSHSIALGWIQGKERLPVHPEYRVQFAALYGNRLCEIAWVAHRLLPLLQHSAFRFPREWVDKWRILDSRFEQQLLFLAGQQEIKLSLAIIEFVKTKLPFNESTLYPLEGLVLPGINEEGPDSQKKGN